MNTNPDYKRAGLLLKLSLVFELAIGVFITNAVAGSGLIAWLIVCIFYFFAHMVQEGKRWMKYPLILWTMSMTFLAGLQLAALVDPDTGAFTGFSLIKAITIISPLGIILWATIIVFRSKSERTHEPEITEADETILDSPNPADTSEQ